MTSLSFSRVRFGARLRVAACVCPLAIARLQFPACAWRLATRRGWVECFQAYPGAGCIPILPAPMTMPLLV